MPAERPVRQRFEVQHAPDHRGEADHHDHGRGGAQERGPGLRQLRIGSPQLLHAQHQEQGDKHQDQGIAQLEHDVGPPAAKDRPGLDGRARGRGVLMIEQGADQRIGGQRVRDHIGGAVGIVEADPGQEHGGQERGQDQHFRSRQDRLTQQPETTDGPAPTEQAHHHDVGGEQGDLVAPAHPLIAP